MHTTSSLGERIKNVRDRFGLKQEEFGNAVGISGNRISEIENDKGGTKAAVLISICREFKVAPEWLISGTGAMLKEQEPAVSPDTQKQHGTDFDARIDALERQMKLIRLEQNRENGPVIEIPLYSSAVVAGIPDLASCEIEEYLEIPASWSHGKKNLYAVKVHGDSMSGIGIMPGDKLLVAACNTAKDSQIVIASINGELTVKTLCIGKNGVVWLAPENRQYKPITITPDMDFRILGIVLASIRNYG
jgi:SOS-response transcriptional repressor LexA